MSIPVTEERRLPPSSMGNARRIKIIRYGRPSDRPKAYLQAGLHADEAPGFLVMHHLMARLEKLHAAGAILGEVAVVPVANPIGVSQWRDDTLQGRFDFFDSINFNRQHLDIAEQLAERLKERLGRQPEDNIALIRETQGQLLGEIKPVGETAHLKHLLLTLAYDADIVLDLHCDHQAVMHVYLGASLWPDAADLAAQLGSKATLLADDSGVTPFDEACSRIWWRLADRFPDHPIPPACLAATVEFRGTADLAHDLAAADAENICRFLQRRGFFRGQPPDLPELPHPATPLSGVEHIKATSPGVVVFAKAPGDSVAPGDLIAEVIDPLAADPEARVIRLTSTIPGILFARSADRFARPGRTLAKIAGKTPIKKSGENLLTL